MKADAARESLADRIPELEPLDEHNRELARHVHPPDWKNPVPPTAGYDLVVIGGGTAGLISAMGASGLGASVALIERGLLGGDCLNVGCVPSKALIRCARMAADVRRAGDFGVIVPGEPRVDFPAVMRRMRRLRAEIARHDSATRLANMGVDVYLGQARFSHRDTLAVGDSELRFSGAVVATGARAAAPPIEGLAETGFLTNETVFSLTELPARLAVIGGGPIGCEMAQSFARFGSDVHLIERNPHILMREAPGAAQIIARAITADGVDILTDTGVESVRRRGPERILSLARNGGTEELAVDQILVGVGRAPNVEGLGLEQAGVEYDRRAGVRVDEFLKTTNPRIFAAGDVCSRYKFTHTADAQARIVVQNALFSIGPFGRARTSTLTIPWCTYTEPELAHVGVSEQEAQQRGIELDTFEVELSEVDRAILDGEEAGMLAIHVRRGSDEILGATLVASHAGEMISEVTLAMVTGAGMGALSRTIHPYPSQAEVFRRAGDAFNRGRLTKRVRRLLDFVRRLKR